MRRSKPQTLSNANRAKRLASLAAAFAAFRRVNEPGRRIPLGLRMQGNPSSADVGLPLTSPSVNHARRGGALWAWRRPWVANAPPGVAAAC